MSETNVFTASAEEVNEARKMLMAAGSSNIAEAAEARHMIAVQAGEVIREAVLDGDTISNIFVKEVFEPGSNMRIDLDLISPGSEDEHVAYVKPDWGKIPHRIVQSDYIMLNTYQIATSIDVTRNLFRNARFDVLRRMIEVLQFGVVKKTNDDGWQTILNAADGRGLVVSDADAAAGVFTPHLVSLMKTVMRRQGGGNASSLNRFKLSDLYMSPEAFEDMTSWGLNLIPDDMRSQIHRSTDGSVASLYGVTFHDMDEFGVGQEYQLYYASTLSGALGASDEEVVIGLDLGARRANTFIMPVTEDVKVFEDNTQHRNGLVSFYATKEHGFCISDVRSTIAGSF